MHDFKYSYLEVCTQDYVNANTVTHTVTNVVTKNRNFRIEKCGNGMNLFQNMLGRF